MDPVSLQQASMCISRPTGIIHILLTRHRTANGDVAVPGISAKINSDPGDGLSINSTVSRLDKLELMLIGAVQGRLDFGCAWAVDRPFSSRSNDPLGPIHSVLCRSSARIGANHRSALSLNNSWSKKVLVPQHEAAAYYNYDRSNPITNCPSW